MATARRYRALGVDELACLVDFGLPDALVLGGLRHLPAIRDAARVRRVGALLSAQEYAGPIWVTLAYCVLYYVFVGHVARVKKALAREYAARGEPFDRYFTTDRRMLAADRLQLNTLEQMGPFLVLLWANAVFVSPLSATVGGAVYVLARALYPVVLSGRIVRDMPGSLLVTTLPGYLVIAWFAASLAWVTLR